MNHWPVPGIIRSLMLCGKYFEIENAARDFPEDVKCVTRPYHGSTKGGLLAAASHRLLEGLRRRSGAVAKARR